MNNTGKGRLQFYHRLTDQGRYIENTLDFCDILAPSGVEWLNRPDQVRKPKLQCSNLISEFSSKFETLIIFLNLC